MANANTAFGFKPVRMQGNSPMSGGIETFYVPSTDATALFIGDPVIKAGSADANGVATVTRSTAAGAISGVVVGFLPDSTGVVPSSRAASTACYVLCSTDPNMLYECQEDAVGGALAAVDVGLNADFIIAAGSTNTHLSGTMLDTSTKATTAGLPLKIMGFVQRPDNVIGANAKVLVKINLNTEVSGSAGV
jgi:hypothetical protein